MEVAITSVKTIRPPLAFHNVKPFKLSLQDQLAPTNYSPLVLFYPINDPTMRTTSLILERLKWSLNKALAPFYPLLGRVRDNLIIDNFDDGVPYIEARVDCNMDDFLENPRMDVLNAFLPFEPFCLQPDPGMPQLAVQLNVFNCGGIALGNVCLHKTNDGTTGSSVIKNWSAICSGSRNIVTPNLTDASLMFPPLDPFPPHYTTLYNRLLSPPERKQITRRYVFSKEAISALRERSKSITVCNPTRVEALSAFIWKSAMSSTRILSSRPRPSILSQSVNIRARTKPRLSRHSIGNLRLAAKVSCDPTDTKSTRIDNLVAKLSQSIDRVDSEYINMLRGEEGSKAMLEDLERFVKNNEGNPGLFTFSSWQTFGLNDLNFGWGKPIWSGVFGGISKVYPSYSNLVILKDNGTNNEVEAWATLDEQLIATLENSHEFLSFARVNPSVLDRVLARVI